MIRTSSEGEEHKGNSIDEESAKEGDGDRDASEPTPAPEEGEVLEVSYMKSTTSSRMQHTPEGAGGISSTEISPKHGGGFKKETVASMANSRAQEAMLRHQVCHFTGSTLLTFDSFR